MGKNKFIDKKKSATYQILSRDTSDPSYSSGVSGDRVFVRVDQNKYQVHGFSDEEGEEEHSNGAVPADDDPNTVFADAPDDYDPGHVFSGNPTRTGSSLPDHIRREILELGFPDDGYNYLLHLREIKNAGGGSFYYENPKAKFEPLPTDVKAYNATKVEISRIKDDSEEASMYAVASKAPNVKVEKVVDDEIAALLDDSDLSRFGSDVEDLEEDFVVKANLPEGLVDLELDKKLKLLERPEANSTEKRDLVVSGMHNTLMESTMLKDEKQRLRRPLDEQFDLLELQEYGAESEDEYGDYDTEEDQPLAEKLNHALKDSALDGIGDNYIVLPDLLEVKKELEDEESPESTADVIQRCKEYAEIYENETEEEKEVIFQESSDESEVWDCETIVSTYSNLDNHPGKIETPAVRRKKKLTETFSGNLNSPGKLIALKGKEKLPVEFLPRSRRDSGDRVKDANVPQPETTKRKQHGQESKEEKKERKASVKEERREARRMKKEIKGLYKSEVQRAQKFAAVGGPSSVHIM